VVARPSRAQHVVIAVVVLAVLTVGLVSASRLAPRTTQVVGALPVAAAQVVVSPPVVAARRVPVARPRAVVRKPVVPAPPVVVRRTARVATRTVTPVPAFTPLEAQRRGAAAYASLGRRLPAGWVMRFEVYRGTYQGLADSGRKVVTIWVRSADNQPRLRITIAHEMGHVLDYTTLTAHDKGRYLSLRGRSGSTARWYPGNGTSDYASPAGDFAEVYALHLAGGGDFRSTFAPQPSSSQLGALCRFFADLEARRA
jgi:hypothetical protein